MTFKRPFFLLRNTEYYNMLALIFVCIYSRINLWSINLANFVYLNNMIYKIILMFRNHVPNNNYTLHNNKLTVPYASSCIRRLSFTSKLLVKSTYSHRLEGGLHIVGRESYYLTLLRQLKTTWGLIACYQNRSSICHRFLSV